MGTRRCESGQCAAARTHPDGSVDVWSTRRPGEVTHLDADELPVSAEVLALLGGPDPIRAEQERYPLQTIAKENPQPHELPEADRA